MTTSVRFYLLYIPIGAFYRIQINFISIKTRIVDSVVVNVRVRVRAKVLLLMWSYDFYDTTISTE